MLLKLTNCCLYEYQRQISDAIIKSVVENEGGEIYMELARQSGKSTTIAQTTFFLSLFYPVLENKVFQVGIFAPKFDQSRITFQRLKDAYDKALPQLRKFGYDFTTYNANEITITNTKKKISSVACLTASPDTTIKGYTFDLIILEECQDIPDKKIKEDIIPMGSSTNATRVLIGTPALGSQYRYFCDGITRNQRVFILPYTTAAKYNPNYTKYIEEVKERIGEDSDEFQSQYNLKWIFGVSKFITAQQLFELRENYEIVKEDKAQDSEIVAGIDIARDVDSTVVTLLKNIGNQFNILNWLELKGEDYEAQVEITKNFLANYNVKRVIIDAVGVGDPVVDMFKNRTRYSIEGFKWTPQSHHEVFLQLQNALLKKRIKYPYGQEAQKTREVKRFEQQMLDLNKEYSGNLLRCHHPDVDGAHDDYVSSLALAFYGMTNTGRALVLPDISALMGSV